jgi:hypothetical protein
VIRKGDVTSKTYAGVARVGFGHGANRLIRTIREPDMFRDETAARVTLARRLEEYANKLRSHNEGGANADD